MLLQIFEPGQVPEPHENTGFCAIGIDLGTSNSVVSWIDQSGTPEIAVDDADRPLLPSAVYYGGKEPLVGYEALVFAATDPENLVTSAKRLMGTNTLIPIKKGTISPVAVAAEILLTIRRRAEKAFGRRVAGAVITVPAYFDDTARAATKQAAHLAGLAVLRLINEPTAAALAYGLESQAEGIYAVYDLGGGTFDVSVLRLQKGIFQVLATGGDTALGGDDLDAGLLAVFLAGVSIDTPLSEAEKRRLLPLIKDAREALTIQESADVTAHLKGRDCSHRLTRADLYLVLQPLLDKTLAITAAVLDEARIEKGALDGVILVGGVTRTWALREAVSRFFGTTIFAEVNPDEVVAIGAARQAAALTEGSETVLLDVTPLSLGIETVGGIVEKVLHRNSPIPTARSQDFTTYADNQTGLVVHVLQGERETVETCRSLGKFVLSGIPPLPAGAARLRVTFAIDADGLLTVSAQELSTGAYQSIEMQPSLDDTTLRSMLIESLQHAGDDMRERLHREAVVDAQRVRTALASALAADAALLTADVAATIKAAEDELAQRLETGDRDAIVAAAAGLEKAARPFVEARINKAVGAAMTGETVDSVARQLRQG
ncbi:MAG: Fe-S protein assembly chaperone HscA [Holosporales bacterium]|jgi:molecular chaperone HscA